MKRNRREEKIINQSRRWVPVVQLICWAQQPFRGSCLHRQVCQEGSAGHNSPCLLHEAEIQHGSSFCHPRSLEKPAGCILSALLFFWAVKSLQGCAFPRVCWCAQASPALSLGRLQSWNHSVTLSPPLFGLDGNFLRVKRLMQSKLSNLAMHLN